MRAWPAALCRPETSVLVQKLTVTLSQPTARIPGRLDFNDAGKAAIGGSRVHILPKTSHNGDSAEAESTFVAQADGCLWQ